MLDKDIIKIFLASTAGAVAVTFGFMMPLIVGGAGMAVDVTKAYLVKNRMCQALDAATLAVGSSIGTQTELEERLQAYLTANYPEEEFGTVTIEPPLITNNLISVKANAHIDTSFMRVLGKEHLDVSCVTEVTREVRGLEVAMVVDVTGSMSSHNNIGALRTAATNFVNILYDRTSDEDSVKIGIVPFSASVNVGPFGLGKNEDGTNYDDAFVNNPSNLQYQADSFNKWAGCVLARNNPDDEENYENGWTWNMYRHTFQGSQSSSIRNNYQAYNNNYGPNYECSHSYIQPLTSNRQKLLDSIQEFQANGNTHGNTGMVWGYRVLSPEFPFKEGAPWEDDKWQKAVLMMTDGDNTISPYYGAYGTYQQYSSKGVNVTYLNRRFEDVCENMKAQGILIYTITFTSNINNTTKDYYRRCASDETRYIDAPSQNDLIEAFERISTELSNLHISR
jgi:Flp pilus assembly protein TadG